MTEAEKIAAKLSKAQRERFLRGSPIGCCARVNVGEALKRKGLVVDGPGRGIYDWSPLGLAVRDIIQKENDRAE